jgi:Deacetylase PdaC
MRSIFAAALLSVSLVAAPAAFAQDQEKSEFSYTYPETLSANPKVVQELEARKTKRAELFEEDVQAVGKDGAANNLESQASWEIKSETDRLIVLVSSNYVYSGGAHGMFWSDAILWDKKSEKEVGFLDMFADKVAAKNAIMPAYCAMLDAERLGLRGEPTPKDDMFGECIDPFENGIVFPTELGTSGYARIEFVLPPYAAGPYVEGEYAFDIAAPDYITSHLKPEYKDLFQTYM